ncbi:unnamed protein product [Calypogeia fissa]
MRAVDLGIVVVGWQDKVDDGVILVAGQDERDL